jgi:hypothetical protein
MNKWPRLQISTTACQQAPLSSHPRPFRKSYQKKNVNKMGNSVGLAHKWLTKMVCELYPNSVLGTSCRLRFSKPTLIGILKCFDPPSSPPSKGRGKKTINRTKGCVLFKSSSHLTCHHHCRIHQESAWWTRRCYRAWHPLSIINPNHSCKAPARPSSASADPRAATAKTKGPVGYRNRPLRPCATHQEALIPKTVPRWPLPKGSPLDPVAALYFLLLATCLVEVPAIWTRTSYNACTHSAMSSVGKASARKRACMQCWMHCWLTSSSGTLTCRSH